MNSMKNADSFTSCPKCKKKEVGNFPFVHVHAKIFFYKDERQIIVTPRDFKEINTSIPGLRFDKEDELVCGTVYSSENCCGFFFQIQMPYKGNLFEYNFSIQIPENINLSDLLESKRFYNWIVERASMQQLTLTTVGGTIYNY